jgi:gamma-glutamyl:cysteine ligase YbdK (ATP-grasp superfamily)
VLAPLRRPLPHFHRLSLRRVDLMGERQFVNLAELMHCTHHFVDLPAVLLLFLPR